MCHLFMIKILYFQIRFNDCLWPLYLGYFYINPFIAISLAITIFSFVGIPPLIGFFAKQMILSAALDNGYVFISLVAILTSVIGAAYYLNLIKQIFFYKDSDLNYKINPSIDNTQILIYKNGTPIRESYK